MGASRCGTLAVATVAAAWLVATAVPVTDALGLSLPRPPDAPSLKPPAELPQSPVPVPRLPLPQLPAGPQAPALPVAPPGSPGVGAGGGSVGGLAPRGTGGRTGAGGNQAGRAPRSGGGTAGRGSARPGSPSARRQAGRKRAERRLRRAVRRLSGCLSTLPAFERRVLVLRSGLGRARPRSARGVARRLGVPTRRVSRAERRGLRRLRAADRRSGCGTATVGPVPGAPAFGPLTPLELTGARLLVRASSAEARPDGSPDSGGVLGAVRSRGGAQTRRGNPAGPAALAPAAASTDDGEAKLPLFLAGALLLLALVAGSMLMARHRRPHADTGAGGTPDAPIAAAGATASSAEAQRETRMEPEPQPGLEPASESASEDESGAVVEAAPAAEPRAEQQPDPMAAPAPWAAQPAPAEPAPRAAQPAPAPHGRRRTGGAVGLAASAFAAAARSGALRRVIESRRRRGR